MRGNGRLLTVQEAAERMDMSSSSVYAMIKSGRLEMRHKPVHKEPGEHGRKTQLHVTEKSVKRLEERWALERPVPEPPEELAFKVLGRLVNAYERQHRAEIGRAVRAARALLDQRASDE